MEQAFEVIVLEAQADLTYKRRKITVIDTNAAEAKKQAERTRPGIWFAVGARAVGKA